MKNRYIYLILFVLLFTSCINLIPVRTRDEIKNDTETEAVIETETNKGRAREQRREREVIVRGKEKKETKETKVIEPEQYSITFVAVGDNLLHDSTQRSALVSEGVYDFSPFYSEIKPIVEKADLAFINQETVMAGASFGHSGYPAFNSPHSLAIDLVNAGFDVFNLANNHAMDKGASGLYATLDYLDTIEGITVIGARKAGESARIITINNITLGFLSYTYGLNGISLPANNLNLVSLIIRDKMSAEIAALRPLCDFLIVSMHWGDEYKLEPGKEQTDLALFLAERNVDLIIGHHPHVLQRVETITLPNGRKTLCYFSLGNFVSHQNERERLIGGMAVLTINKKEIIPAPDDKERKPEKSADENEMTAAGEKNDEEVFKAKKPFEISITDFGIMPLVTHYDRDLKNTKVYPLYLYTKELVESHAIRRRDSNLTMEFFHSVSERLKTVIIMRNPFEAEEITE